MDPRTFRLLYHIQSCDERRLKVKMVAKFTMLYPSEEDCDFSDSGFIEVSEVLFTNLVLLLETIPEWCETSEYISWCPSRYIMRLKRQLRRKYAKILRDGRPGTYF